MYASCPTYALMTGFAGSHPGLTVQAFVAEENDLISVHWCYVATAELESFISLLSRCLYCETGGGSDFMLLESTMRWPEK